MPLTFKDGKMVALIKSKKKNRVLMVEDKGVPDDANSKLKLIDDDKYEPLLDPDTRSITYICGASGSGKSTVTKGLIEKFHDMFPDSPVYLFSRLLEDPAFDGLEKKGIITRIPINDNLVENPIDVTSDIEHGSLVVFDDIDTINNKPMMEVLKNIKSQILEIGRHNKIYCIVTSHLINTNDRNSTRTMMNEMSNLVIFPQGGGSAYQQRYCLKNYLGLGKNEIDTIMNTRNSRWVLISKNYPQYVLTEKICYLL